MGATLDVEIAIVGAGVIGLAIALQLLDDGHQVLLIDPETNDLNNKGTLFLDSKGRRICINDTLEDGEVIAFMVGIAGG